MAAAIVEMRISRFLTCVSSWPMTSGQSVNDPKISPSPSPKTICSPSQNALSYSCAKCTDATSASPAPSSESRP